jgi:hypothetical protein
LGARVVTALSNCRSNMEVGIMTGTVKEIVEAKRQAGEDAFLWLRPLWECSLWPSEDSCDVGDEREILDRWDLDAIEYEQLIETGLVDRED